MGELGRAPVRAITSRFGQTGLQAVQRASGLGRESAWPVFRPEERIIETVSVDPDQGIMNLEPVLFLLRPVLDRVMARVRGRAEAVAAFELLVLQERHSGVRQAARNIEFTLHFPHSDAAILMPLVQERLNREFQLQPLEAPVNCLRIETTATVPGPSRQKDFYSRKEEDGEAWGGLVGRLHERLGLTRAFRAAPARTWLPENRVSGYPLMHGASAALAAEPRPDFARRPLVLLKQPKLLRRLQQWFLYEDPGSGQHARRKCVALEGPERLGGEWWFRTAERSYYRATLEDGAEWWIYRTADSPHFYLHGVFE
jgi:protein ImuB